MIDKLKHKMYLFDSEVFAEDWLIVFNKLDDESKWYAFHNDSVGLNRFLEDNPDIILVGYNCKHYDQYILKGCLLGYDPFVIREINDYIIVDGEQGWTYPFDYLSYDKQPPMLDLMLDIVPMKSLKEIEGSLGLDITETTIDFNNTTKWTKKMYEEILTYCKADVSALRPLLELREPYIQTKLKIADMVNLEPASALSMTNAKLTADFLKAKRYNANPDEVFEFPKNLDLQILPEDIKEFFMTMESKYNPDGSINEDASHTYMVDIADCPHKLGFGGLHGALNNYEEESSDTRIIVNYDVTSYYPSLMVKYNYVSRATEYPELYEQAYNLRIEAKKNGDMDTSDALKLVLNTAFGASNNKYNKLYDPLMAKSICVSGQCFLIDLILHLKKLPTFRLIQSNTDGIMFSIDKNQYSMVKYAIRSWEKRTGFNMEDEEISKIWQRDVNNYIMLTKSGKIKSKGSVFASYNNGSGDKFRGYSMAIVGEAIIKYFKDNVPIEETILNCDDISKFQIIAKTGGSYDGTILETKDGMVQVQKCNRVFAGTDNNLLQIKKVKLTNNRFGGTIKTKKFRRLQTERYMKLHPELTFSHEEDGYFIYIVQPIPYPIYPFKRGMFISRLDTVANCPQHTIIDNNNELSVDKVNKLWYTKYTNKEIEKMKGVN